MNKNTGLLIFPFLLLLAWLHRQISAPDLPMTGLLPGLQDSPATRHLIVLGIAFLAILLIVKNSKKNSGGSPS